MTVNRFYCSPNKVLPLKYVALSYDVKTSQCLSDSPSYHIVAGAQCLHSGCYQRRRACLSVVLASAVCSLQTLFTGGLSTTWSSGARGLPNRATL